MSALVKRNNLISLYFFKYLMKPASLVCFLFQYQHKQISLLCFLCQSFKYKFEYSSIWPFYFFIKWTCPFSYPQTCKSTEWVSPLVMQIWKCQSLCQTFQPTSTFNNNTTHDNNNSTHFSATLMWVVIRKKKKVQLIRPSHSQFGWCFFIQQNKLLNADQHNW